jgi:hypothetical protein
VGFNAGHSAIAFLLARPNVELVSFDLLEHPYGRPAEAFVATAFPGRHRVFLARPIARCSSSRWPTRKSGATSRLLMARIRKMLPSRTSCS